MAPSTSAASTPWSASDSLELVGIISKKGVEAWPAVAAALSKQPISPEACAGEFKRLAAMIHKRNLVQASDRGHLLEIAKLLSSQRISDIQEQLHKEALEFKHLVQNIQDIRDGKWDDRIPEFKKKRKIETTHSRTLLGQEENAGGISVSSDKTTQDTSGQRSLFRDVELEVPSQKAPPKAKHTGTPASNAAAIKGSSTFLGSLPSQVSAFAAGVMHGLLGKEGAATAYTKKDKETAKKDVIQTAEEQEPKVAERRSSRRRRDEPEDTEMDVAETDQSVAAPAEVEDMDLSGVEDTPSGGRRRVSRVDEKYKKWRQNSLMIWNKIADHRKGNTFLRKIKDDNYYKLIKEPMTLEMVKTRIREGIIKTTAEFHRDLSLVFANAIMFNDEDSDVYADALEIKAFADAELQNLLVNANE